MEKQKDIYRSSRVLYIASATIEYFIAILTGSAYLAKIAGAIGIDDGTIGVLTSFTALGCVFQIVSLAMRTDKAVKPTVVLINLANQLCFTLLYVIPIVNLPKDAKTIIFIILLLSGNMLLNIPFPPKVAWSRTLVDDSKRGIFSANCEITSLICGMIFTTLAGRAIDTLEANGNQRGAFILCGVTILVLTVSHALCLLFIREDKRPKSANESLGEMLKSAIRDRNTLTLIPVFVLWNAAVYVTVPFFGTYQINELSFNMTTVALISVCYAIVRSLVSTPLGILGDKRSFIASMTVSLTAMSVGLLINSLGGRVPYVIFYILYAVALAGMNSGVMNLIFDYVSFEKRARAISILYTIGGLSGFFSTLIVKPLVDRIQANGNSFLCFKQIYAQQVLSLIGALLSLATVIYLNTAIKRLAKEKRIQ